MSLLTPKLLSLFVVSLLLFSCKKVSHKSANFVFTEIRKMAIAQDKACEKVFRTKKNWKLATKKHKVSLEGISEYLTTQAGLDQLKASIKSCRVKLKASKKK